jgi:hypothetical protein
MDKSCLVWDRTGIRIVTAAREELWGGTALVSGPAPAVSLGQKTCGEIEVAEQREWLVANGRGSYASGTVANMLTRGYHGLLVAALSPPLGRTVMLVKTDATLTYRGSSYDLFANRWSDGAVVPAGHRLIERFWLDGTIPVWRFACGDVISDDSRQQVVEASRLAESLRLYNSSYHAELDWWTGSFEATEGIPYSSLPSEAESSRVDIERVFPRPHHSERRTQISKDYSTILVLSTDHDNRTDALATGEALSAILLECTMAGLATCTVSHVTEVRASRDLIATLLEHDAVPQVLVRVGMVPTREEVPPPTPRRPLDEVLHIENRKGRTE